MQYDSHDMQRLSIALASLILIGAGCGSAAPASPTPPPPPPAPTASPPPKAEPADIRVTGIKGTGNAAGVVNADGCDGPRVDLVLTVQNLGADYPTESGLSQFKSIIESQKGQLGAKPYEETALFTVVGEVDFDGGRRQSFSAEVLPGTLSDGMLKSGQSVDLKASVQAPCCDPLPGTIKATASIRQESSLVATGSKGMKEPYEDSFELALPDVTPGHGQLYIKDGKGTVVVEVENIGKAPTAGPVKVQVSLARVGSAFAAANWEKQYDQPFTGKVSIGPMDVTPIVGEPDRSKIDLRVFSLCPSEKYDLIQDANPQNDHVVRSVK